MGVALHLIDYILKLESAVHFLRLAGHWMQEHATQFLSFLSPGAFEVFSPLANAYIFSHLCAGSFQQEAFRFLSWIMLH
ncbi:hypothetical protein ABC383_09825 [Noviherbaspirillum sp. 1P10PC]|uniref:hypothetical protein n=1 Tax=Noviherbaspirillum sp. 1P10PC TaxID=3132292 RepID=UPI0039A081BF